MAAVDASWSSIPASREPRWGSPFTGGCYPATAIAAEPTRCLFLTHAAVTRAMAADPGLAFFFLKRLSSRVQSLVERVDQITVNSVQTRLARFILDRHQAARAAARSRTETRNGVTFSSE